MSDIEKRRLKLLQETRKIYSDTYAPPAIHPRFQSTYRSLYEENEETNRNSSLLMRVALAILIFSLCFIMENDNQKIGSIDCNTIIDVLQDDLFSK